jgi:hypothetical protein
MRYFSPGETESAVKVPLSYESCRLTQYTERTAESESALSCAAVGFNQPTLFVFQAA